MRSEVHLANSRVLQDQAAKLLVSFEKNHHLMNREVH